MNLHLSVIDLAVVPIFLALIGLYCLNYRGVDKRIFVTSLWVKLFSSLVFCYIYMFYYTEGGDTFVYFDNAIPYINLLFEKPRYFFINYFGANDFEHYHNFDYVTGYPSFYYFSDEKVMTVVKIMVPIVLISFKSYIATTLLLSFLSFFPLWKFYKTLCRRYPTIKRSLKWVLFIPSAVFWGSGILKDTFTFMALLFIINRLLSISEGRKNLIGNILVILIGVIAIISIKPYIFLGLLPASVLLLSISRIGRIKKTIYKLILTPIIITVSVLLGVLFWTLSSDFLGIYADIDSIAQKAHVSYEDLKRDYYEGNSFDLGEYDPTLEGMLSKFPEAVVAGLYRPFIWESANVVMILSGIENLILLILTVYAFVKVGIKLPYVILKDSFLTFCLFFTIIMGFSIAISTTNFGALVRFKIPLLPFFFCLLILLINNKKIQQFNLSNS